jgi:hypothetical protein
MSDKYEDEWVLEWKPTENRKSRLIYDSAKEAFAALAHVSSLGFTADAYRRLRDAGSLPGPPQDLEDV